MMTNIAPSPPATHPAAAAARPDRWPLSLRIGTIVAGAVASWVPLLWLAHAATA